MQHSKITYQTPHSLCTPSVFARSSIFEDRGQHDSGHGLYLNPHTYDLGFAALAPVRPLRGSAGHVFGWRIYRSPDGRVPRFSRSETPLRQPVATYSSPCISLYLHLGFQLLPATEDKPLRTARCPFCKIFLRNPQKVQPTSIIPEPHQSDKPCARTGPALERVRNPFSAHGCHCPADSDPTPSIAVRGAPIFVL